jgi:alanyl-tRNA synthetase
VSGVTVVSGLLPDADADTLRGLTDRFRLQHPSGVIVLGSVHDGKPVLIAAVSQDWVAHGLHAGELVKAVAQKVGGGGGGKPTLAQAGGKDPSQLAAALDAVDGWITGHLR